MTAKEREKGIILRLADTINSNQTAILDRAEDPGKIIRLMIQEMEETLVEVRSTAVRLNVHRNEARRSLDRQDVVQTEWRRRAELAVSCGRESLDKGALMERAKLERMAETLAVDVDGLNAALTHHEDDFAKLEAKLCEARAEQKTIQAL